MTTLTRGNDQIEVQAALGAKFDLTSRQKDVAYLVYTGLQNRQIADLLFVTEKAIKFHATNIYNRCRVRNRKELIALIEKLCKRS